MTRGFDMLRLLLPAGACLICAVPGAAAQRDHYYVPNASAVELQFSALDPDRAPIDEQWLLKDLTTALQERSGWPLSSVGTVTTELFGLRTRLDSSQSRIVFEYVHMDRNRLGQEWGETLTVPVSYRIDRVRDTLVVRLQPSAEAEFETRKTLGFFLATPKLKPITEVLEDFSAIMEGAHSLELHHSYLLSGEEEANASPDTCIERFDHLFGRYGYARDEEHVFDTKRDNVFLYRTAKDSIPLKVVAVRYRGGSKVFYEAWVPFQLRADGMVRGYTVPVDLRSDLHRILESGPSREAEGGPDGSHEKGKLRN